MQITPKIIFFTVPISNHVDYLIGQKGLMIMQQPSLTIDEEKTLKKPPFGRQVERFLYHTYQLDS